MRGLSGLLLAEQTGTATAIGYILPVDENINKRHLHLQVPFCVGALENFRYIAITVTSRRNLHRGRFHICLCCRQYCYINSPPSDDFIPV